MKKIKQVKEHMKDVNMKRLFRRNQIIITTLAVMIAAAGYLNYAGNQELDGQGQVYEAGAMDISDEDILAENQAVMNEAGDGVLQEIPVWTIPWKGTKLRRQRMRWRRLCPRNLWPKMVGSRKWKWRRRIQRKNRRRRKDPRLAWKIPEKQC